jgi:hypothetical protein
MFLFFLGLRYAGRPMGVVFLVLLTYDLWQRFDATAFMDDEFLERGVLNLNHMFW